MADPTVDHSPITKQIRKNETPECLAITLDCRKKQTHGTVGAKAVCEFNYVLHVHNISGMQEWVIQIPSIPILVSVFSIPTFENKIFVTSKAFGSLMYSAP